jgi:hypothetical protein
MANSEFIEILSPSALKDLQTANAELVTMISNVDKVGTKMKGITTPSGSDSAIKGLTAEYQKQEKIITNLQNKVVKANEVAQRQAEKTRLAEIKLAQQREQAFDKFDKNLAREQAKLNASLNLYNKTQKQLNNITASYNDLITRKLRYNNLSDNEEKRLLTLQRVTERYNTTLKAVDATIGKNQRNVGNYASAFNPLSNSINQLTREMPAFTYSVQTGFMALSNNIPIFTDAISNAIAQNKALQAEGKPTTSVLSQLAGAFLSWGTALSVGITLLTVYGKEIGEFISGSESKKKALEAEKKAIEEKSKAEEQARDKLARFQSDEISRAKILFENAKNLTLSMSERTKAVNELQKRYPDYLGSLSKEKILAGDTADAELKLNDALIKRGIALASQQAIQEEINNNLKNEKWLADQLRTIEEKRLNLGKQINQIDPFTKDENLSKKYEELSLQLTRLFYLEGTLKEQYQSKNNIIRNSIDFYIKQYNENAKYLNIVREETKETEKNTKAKKDNNKELEKKGEFLSKERLQSQISALQEELNLTSKLNPAYKILSDTLRGVNSLYDALYGEKKVVKAQEEIIDALELTDEAVYADYFAWLKLKEATDSYLKTLSSDAFNKAFDNIGLSSAKMFLDFDADGKSTFDKLFEGADSMKEKFAITFQAVGDVAQDVFNKINEMSNQRFENQRMNLEREYKIGLAFAGDSASARAEIEKQYQERQREIQKKEFKARKAQALVNIAIDTAQAIIATLARTPPPLGTGLAIAMGALGAVQAGLVASQQMPQFWKGTDNAPEGWALTQERGREIITDSKGNIKSLGNDKGATMTYLNKGDKVKTASETMDYLMFNNELNAMLTNNSIDKAPSVNIQNTNIDLSPVVKAINDKPVANIGIDKDGLEMYVTTANQTKEVMNRRKTFNGNKV